jgi:hypothetical protein
MTYYYCCDLNNQCVGPTGAVGPTGSAGQSSYDIWLASGNSGSTAEFLNSIKGETGPTGIGQTGAVGPTGSAGQSSYDIWLASGNSGSTAEFLNSIKGETGPTGSEGSTLSFYATSIGTSPNFGTAQWSFFPSPQILSNTLGLNYKTFNFSTYPTISLYNFDPNSLYYYNVRVSLNIQAVGTLILAQRITRYTALAPDTPNTVAPTDPAQNTNQSVHTAKSLASINNCCWTGNITGIIKVDNVLDQIWFSGIMPDVGAATNSVTSLTSNSFSFPIETPLQIIIYKI